MCVPITIIQDNDVCRRQIDTETAGTSCQQENELLASRPVVLVDSSNAVLVTGTSVNPAVTWA